MGRDGRGALVTSLVLLGLLAWLGFVSRPLMPIDETRYVGVAWEMWQRGDLLVPFKNGETYSHKPPLLFWIFHAGWALFGVNDWWPRLVLPLFSAGSLGLTYLLARRLWPQHAGLGGQASLVLVSTALWIVFSTVVMLDVMLAFWVLLGVYGILIAADGRGSGFGLLGVAMGMGVLAKGPVALLHLLPVAALAPWWNPGVRSGRWFAGIGLAVVLGVAMALAWAVPAGFAGGEAYRRAILWGQTADRVVGSFAHRRPVWWYLPLLPLMLFPWFVWTGFWRAVAGRRRAGLDRGLRFCLAWMMPVLLAFSLISSKQPHYLIPLFPAFALLAARLLAERSSGRVGLPALAAVVIGIALVLVAGGRIPALQDDLATLPPAWPGVALVLVAGGVWWAGRRGISAGLTLVVLGAGTMAMVQIAAMGALRPLYEVEPMARAIRAVQDEGHVVANLGSYHAQYHFLGRLEQPLVELRGPEVEPWLDAHPGDYAVVYLKDREALAAITARHKQPYRGGAAVLADARTAARLLADPSARRRAIAPAPDQRPEASYR